MATEKQQKRVAAQREREVRSTKFERKLGAYPVPYETLPRQMQDNQGEELINAG